MSNFNVNTLTIVAITSTGKKLTLSTTDERSIAYYSVFEKGIGSVRFLQNKDSSVVKNHDDTIRLARPDRFDNRVKSIKVDIQSIKTGEKADPAADDSMFD